jgi:predicted DNA-binding protein
MPRPKKDGKYINYYIERELYEKLRDLAVERGQTMTTAIERILKDYFDKLEDAEK